MKNCAVCSKKLGFFKVKNENQYYCFACYSKLSGNTPEIKEEMPDGGAIKYYNLTTWWINELTKDERDVIMKMYLPTNSGADYLIKEKITFIKECKVSFLYTLATWLDHEDTRHIAYKILKKAELGLATETDILNIHFFYNTKIEIYYKYRNKDEDSYEIAKQACLQQINCATAAKTAFKRDMPRSPLPSHTGYSQLCIILEKEKKYNESIELAKKAKKQGWAGDWDKRIERCKSKSNKNKNEIQPPKDMDHLEILKVVRQNDMQYHLESAINQEKSSDFKLARLSYLKFVESAKQFNSYNNNIYQDVENYAKEIYADFVLNRDPFYKKYLETIKPVIAFNEGILQKDIYDKIPDLLKEDISYCLYFSEIEGVIKREKAGRSYRLILLQNL